MKTAEEFYNEIKGNYTIIELMEMYALEVAKETQKRCVDELGKQAYALEAVAEVGSKEINETVTSIEEVVEYLNKSGVSLESIASKHSKAIGAIYALIVIAEAWNKADNFVPDFDNKNQHKYFPWFYKKDGGFVYSSTNVAASATPVAIGSRFCFKTRERAEQFGKQFIDLWNDFLLFR